MHFCVKQCIELHYSIVLVDAALLCYAISGHDDTVGEQSY